jgi:hypothetical protein
MGQATRIDEVKEPGQAARRPSGLAVGPDGALKFLMMLAGA